MTPNTVNVDTTTSPATLTFAESFNVAVPFIDRHLTEGRGERVAIRTMDGDTTYAGLAEGVNRAGNALLDLGLHRGDRVLMVVKDSPVFPFLFWGAIKAGLVPIPVNTLLHAKDYQHMIADSEAACVIWSPEFADEVKFALSVSSPGPRCKFPTEGNEDNFATRMAAAAITLDPAPASASDDCFWLYTSGSTGAPKGAVHAHRDMVVTSQNYGVDTLGAGANDVYLSAAKLFFAYGLGNAMTFPFWTGGQAILWHGRSTPDAMFEHIEKFRPTIYFGVPTLFASQLQTLANTSPDISSLRVCVSAGEPLPANIFERWEARTNLQILDGIGTTENLHIFISNRPGDAKTGVSGKPVPGCEARILDDEEQPVATGEVGHLLIRSQSLTSRYWNLPERTAAVLQDGWIRTGDSYYQDEDGYFICCGRSDDMLKVGGIWVSPVEIESRLIAHDAVLEAAVVGRADDDELIKAEAFVILNSGHTPTEELADELTAFCKTGLARFKYPRWLHFVDELPKTATGKIQRFKLRA
ncbi:MAG: benzoate-CoA ligase family protein [Alphaproteobacteria bacterium]|nr:benzoate-CoA ligase family protein [Alphaproteobacteria bacterium]